MENIVRNFYDNIKENTYYKVESFMMELECKVTKLMWEKKIS